jgi:hypothetical protein
VEKENDLTEGGEQPRDHFYHGVITKIFWGNETGVIRSDSGRDVPFVFPFVTLLGVPRQDINFLRQGMRVGFDVGWTSKGLRATVIKIYDLLEGQSSPEQEKPPEEFSHHGRQDSDVVSPEKMRESRKRGGGRTKLAN